jgi:hypothetical protein
MAVSSITHHSYKEWSRCISCHTTMSHRLVRQTLTWKRDMNVCNLVTLAADFTQSSLNNKGAVWRIARKQKQMFILEGHWNVMSVTCALCGWELVEKLGMYNGALWHFCEEVQYNTDLTIPQAAGNAICCCYSHLLSSLLTGVIEQELLACIY